MIKIYGLYFAKYVFINYGIRHQLIKLLQEWIVVSLGPFMHDGECEICYSKSEIIFHCLFDKIFVPFSV